MDEVTGNPQPSYRLEGLKITAEFPKLKGDEEQEQDNVERKQVGVGVSGWCISRSSAWRQGKGAARAENGGMVEGEAVRGKLGRARRPCGVLLLGSPRHLW